MLNLNSKMEVMEQAILDALIALQAIYPKFDVYGDHCKNTPHRIAKAWIEMCKGLGPMDFEFTTFPNESLGNGWIIKKDIEFSSLCQHHMLPYMGKVHIGYIPGSKICGISKLDRAVKYFSKRPSVQEIFGDQIAMFLYDRLLPQKLAVIVESLHTCVACRGAESRNSTMITYHDLTSGNDAKEFKEWLR
jgi:GTP cyclohydrolase I